MFWLWGVPGRIFTGLVGVDMSGDEKKAETFSDGPKDARDPHCGAANSMFGLEAQTGMTPPIVSAISSAIESVQQQVVSAALVYTSHERWPLSSTQSLPRSPLRISVLDSSFNPPTLAHLALANAPNPSSPASDYDAKLLLLSVKNADKLLQEGDATLCQRVEMMSLLATRVHHNGLSSPPNIAVGLVNEPTFIAKSSTLHGFLSGRLAELTSDPPHSISTQLTFLMGSSHYIYWVCLNSDLPHLFNGV